MNIGGLSAVSAISLHRSQTLSSFPIEILPLYLLELSISLAKSVSSIFTLNDFFTITVKLKSACFLRKTAFPLAFKWRLFCPQTPMSRRTLFLISVPRQLILFSALKSPTLFETSPTRLNHSLPYLFAVVSRSLCYFSLYNEYFSIWLTVTSTPLFLSLFSAIQYPQIILFHSLASQFPDLGHPLFSLYFIITNTYTLSQNLF